MAFGKMISAAALVVLAASAAFAQEDDRPRQVEVQGETNNTQYPRFVLADNGVTYFCEENTTIQNGEEVRACILGDRTAGAGGTAAPISATPIAPNVAIVAGAGGVVIALASQADGGNNNTSATSSTGTTSGTN